MLDGIKHVFLSFWLTMTNGIVGKDEECSFILIHAATSELTYLQENNMIKYLQENVNPTFLWS